MLFPKQTHTNTRSPIKDTHEDGSNMSLAEFLSIEYVSLYIIINFLAKRGLTIIIKIISSCQILSGDVRIDLDSSLCFPF